MNKIYRGEGLDVVGFTDSMRKNYGLASKDTIVEIDGDDALMREMYDYCKLKKVVGFDAETTGLNFINDRMVLAQIGDQERQYLIWLDNTDPDKLLEILRDPDVVKIGLNLKFDLTFSLYQFGNAEARAQNVVDVMLTAQILMCGIYDNVGLTMKMGSMGMQSRHWLGLEIPKDPELRIGWAGYDPRTFDRAMLVLQNEITSANENTQHALDARTMYDDAMELRRQKILYAADDVCIPIMLAELHKPWIVALGLVPTVNLEHRFLPVLADIEARGLPFDQDAWMVLAETAEDGVRTSRHDLDTLFDVEVTITVDEEGTATYSRDKKYSSPVQLVSMIREWMWDNCGVEVISNNGHFKEALSRYGRLNGPRLDMLFATRTEENPVTGKKTKHGYPNMKDTLHLMWDLYKDYLPETAFVLPDTDSKTLKFFKVIYGTDDELLEADKKHLPTTFGLPSDLIDPILAMRGYSKSASTYGRNWLDILSTDGRVHTNFRQCSLSTGRLSSTPNAQNFPADAAYRACFKAQPGFKITGADYSQVEPRVIAHLSQDPTYMRVFWSEFPDSGGFQKWCDSSVTEELDLYTEVGKATGQLPSNATKLMTVGDEDLGIEPLPWAKKGRKQAKISNLGLGYGTGVKKFHFMLCIDTGEYHTLVDVKDMYDDYWKAMTVVKRFLDTSSNFTDPEKSKRKVAHPYATGKNELVTYAETILGRKRFFQTSNPGHWTQGRNMPIQGSAGGDMLKLAALELTEWAWCASIEGGIVNLIHDELLAEVREDQAEEYAAQMQIAMEKAGQDMCPSVPITAPAYVEDYWRK